MSNHRKSATVKIKTQVKAGGISTNHNESLVRKSASVKIKTQVKAGGMGVNHNESFVA